MATPCAEITDFLDKSGFRVSVDSEFGFYVVDFLFGAEANLDDFD